MLANVVLADEINRAPAKVQVPCWKPWPSDRSALGKHRTHSSPVFRAAKQYPIEQEGTYPLPEAQVDRFMLKVVIDYSVRPMNWRFWIEWAG